MTKSYWDYTGQGESIGHFKPSEEARIRWVVDMATRLTKAGDDKVKLTEIANEYESHGMRSTAQQIRIKHGL